MHTDFDGSKADLGWLRAFDVLNYLVGHVSAPWAGNSHSHGPGRVKNRDCCIKDTVESHPRL